MLFVAQLIAPEPAPAYSVEGLPAIIVNLVKQCPAQNRRVKHKVCSKSNGHL